MRITLDPDTEQIIRRWMRERRMTFKEALNDVIRSAVAGPSPFHTETASLGEPTHDLGRALQVAAQLEDEALLRRMQAES